MGGSRKDYRRVAPKGSYLHVEDFKSPKHLANYLHQLDQNDTLYNSYFQWKGTGEVQDVYWKKYWCDMCVMLHDEKFMATKKWFNMEEWWLNGKCRSGFWRSPILPSTSLNDDDVEIVEETNTSFPKGNTKF